MSCPSSHHLKSRSASQETADGEGEGAGRESRWSITCSASIYACVPAINKRKQCHCFKLQTCKVYVLHIRAHIWPARLIYDSIYDMIFLLEEVEKQTLKRVSNKLA